MGYLSSVVAFLAASWIQPGGWIAFWHGVDKFGMASTVVTTLVGTSMLVGWLIGAICGMAGYAIHRLARRTPTVRVR